MSSEIFLWVCFAKSTHLFSPHCRAEPRASLFALPSLPFSPPPHVHRRPDFIALTVCRMASLWWWQYVFWFIGQCPFPKELSPRELWEHNASNHGRDKESSVTVCKEERREGKLPRAQQIRLYTGRTDVYFFPLLSLTCTQTHSFNDCRQTRA